MLTWAFMWFAAKSLAKGADVSLGLSYIFPVVGDVLIFYFIAVMFRGWP